WRYAYRTWARYQPVDLIKRKRVVIRRISSAHNLIAARKPDDA
ncbi:hypothetical protein LTSEBAI_0239, partial [Salmonella enterica subsp. enterica serovar Baildon str. R6-199]